VKSQGKSLEEPSYEEEPLKKRYTSKKRYKLKVKDTI
jgi:hypothetical protein